MNKGLCNEIVTAFFDVDDMIFYDTDLTERSTTHLSNQDNHCWSTSGSMSSSVPPRQHRGPYGKNQSDREKLSYTVALNPMHSPVQHLKLDKYGDRHHNRNCSHDTNFSFQEKYSNCNFGLDLESIFAMSSMETDNPFEPRPLHPSVELLALRSEPEQLFQKRRMSLNQMLDEIWDDFSMQSDGSISESNSHSFIVHKKEEKTEVTLFTNEALNDQWEPSETNMVFGCDLDPAAECSQGNEPSSLPLMTNNKVTCFDDMQFALPPELSLYCLKKLMAASRRSQKLLQEWDKKHGLPASHCWTMMHTNRSRKQLEEGRILPKWNGTPLISDNASNVSDSRKRKQSREKMRQVKNV